MLALNSKSSRFVDGLSLRKWKNPKPTFNSCPISPAALREEFSAGNDSEGYDDTDHPYEFDETLGVLPDKPALTNAAANGHLPVIEWLHSIRLQGCTKEAMDRAAGGGHLTVVKWLHANRT